MDEGWGSLAEQGFWGKMDEEWGSLAEQGFRGKVTWVSGKLCLCARPITADLSMAFILGDYTLQSTRAVAYNYRSSFLASERASSRINEKE